MSAVRPSLLIVLSCTCLSACTAVWTGSAGAVGLVVVGWLLFAARSNAADGGPDADQGVDMGADAGADAAPEIQTTVCLCMAHPGAAPAARAVVPGFDPLAIQARVRAALPADVQARLKD